ncbi:hypothetical protein [Sediminicola sp. 1XM1-17]|uniref:hypothetical protein n=1 Tax=Sediminicola sp. 1XM1-17 TaxID=3127702 RepID=UPI003077D438
MNTIQMISIFACGFALGLILFILLEKLFVPEVDNEDYDLYRIKDNKKKPMEPVPVNSKISAKQNFISGKLGFSYAGSHSENTSSINHLKSKIFELKKGNKVAL